MKEVAVQNDPPLTIGTFGDLHSSFDIVAMKDEISAWRWTQINFLQTNGSKSDGSISALLNISFQLSHLMKS